MLLSKFRHDTLKNLNQNVRMIYMIGWYGCGRDYFFHLLFFIVNRKSVLPIGLLYFEERGSECELAY